MTILIVHVFLIDVVHQIQVSCVTDHVGSQDTTAKSADLDDDEGGLVSLSRYIKYSKLVFSTWHVIKNFKSISHHAIFQNNCVL